MAWICVSKKTLAHRIPERKISMNLHGRTLRKGVCMKLNGRTQTRAEEFR